MEEKIRARKAKEKAENALDNLLEKAEAIGGLLRREKTFWQGMAECLEGIAELCAAIEKDIPGSGGGGRRRYPYRIKPQAPEIETHSLRC